jgi:membrane-bound lytic murein transglycosylase A
VIHGLVRWTLLLPAVLLAGCAGWFAPPPGVGKEIPFSRLPGWSEENHAEAWPALLKSCDKLATREAWHAPCEAARALPAPDAAAARAFFEQWFTARVMNGDDGRDGLITGYYEPVLAGSLTRSARYSTPLYRRPDNLLVVDLAGLFPELKGKTVRGRLEGNRVVPFFSRGEIVDGRAPLAGQELLWVDDPVEAFVLQVQGSGRVRLDDGSEIAVGYADQNGHPYRAIGARLIERGVLKREEVTLPRIREWLAANPDERSALLDSNPSYVFFARRAVTTEGPLGSQGVALSAERSIAVDAAFIPLGSPVWLETTLPDGRRWQRLMLAQDTGGAIKGAVRADIFFGQGATAGELAGNMKSPGRLTVLVPKPPPVPTQLSRNESRQNLIEHIFNHGGHREIK